MSEARKYDSAKPRYSLIPGGVLRSVVDVLEYGARKYEADNWKGLSDARTRYYDACKRHVEAWWEGETYDPESGFPHLSHAICCLAFLWWFDHGKKEVKF